MLSASNHDSNRPSDEIPYAIKSQITKIGYSDPNFTAAILKRATDFAVASAFNAAIRNSALDSMTIKSCKIGEDSSVQMRECLSENVAMETLDVDNCVITSKRFRRIMQGLGRNGKDSGITELHFTSCALDGRCGEYFGEFLCSDPPEVPLCRNLAVINLQDNQIGDRGAVGLSYLLHPEGRLIRLHLGKNRIGDRGAVALANMLLKNKTLHTLDLGHNIIGADGGIALASMLRENKYLSR